MATIDSSLLARLAAPEFGKTLYDIGTAPAERRKKQRQAKVTSGLFALEQQAIAGELDPEVYQEAVGSYRQLMQQNPDMAEEIRSSLGRIGGVVSTQRKTRDEIKVKTQINNLRNAAMTLSRDRNLSDEDKERSIQFMKSKLEKIRNDNPNIDLTEFDGMFEDVIVEARQLNKQQDIDNLDAANRKLSQQIYQVTDLKALDSLTSSLLKSNPQNAEAIKKFSSVQQASIIDKQERDRRNAENSYDFSSSIESVRANTENLPEQVQQMVEQKLQAAEDEQRRNRDSKNNTWSTVSSRKNTEKLIDDASRLIDNYRLTNISTDQRQIATIEGQLSELAARGKPVATLKQVEDIAQGMSIEEYGKPYDELTGPRLRDVTERARAEATTMVETQYNTEVRVLRRQLAALRGEEVEETETNKETPKIRPLKGPEDYDGMVSNALARGNSPQYVRNSLKRIGIPPKQIIALVDKYSLPQDVDFVEETEESETKRSSTAVPFVYTQR